MERADRYKRDIEEYYNKIKELNEMLMLVDLHQAYWALGSAL